MNPFSYGHADDNASAVRQAQESQARFLGGGTNLVDLMRETIERPSSLVDVSGLSTTMEDSANGGLLIGGGVKNTVLAENWSVKTRYPALTRAIVAGASPQIRNMATVGGNILQRTRCAYFYDLEGAACNKRNPGSGCDAVDGFNRMHAILGASPACVATHPSDMCVALATFDTVVHLEGANGARTLPLEDFHCLPGDHPEIETMLGPGELITAVELPPLPFSWNSTYRKVRDRSSYAFALVSVAAALAVKDGLVCDVRVALGGVALKPWRARIAESNLVGQPANAASFRAAAEAELAHARPLSGNGFKIELAARTVTAVLGELAGELM